MCPYSLSIPGGVQAQVLGLARELRRQGHEARVLGPEDDLVTTETYAAVDAALADLDPIDAGLVTLVDIEGAPLNRAALELDLSSGEARERLARARFAVRAALDRYLRSSTPTTRTASLTRPSEKERTP